MPWGHPGLAGPRTPYSCFQAGSGQEELLPGGRLSPACLRLCPPTSRWLPRCPGGWHAMASRVPGKLRALCVSGSGHTRSTADSCQSALSGVLSGAQVFIPYLLTQLWSLAPVNELLGRPSDILRSFISKESTLGVPQPEETHVTFQSCQVCGQFQGGWLLVPHRSVARFFA